MTHSLLVTNPVVPHLQVKTRKVYSLYEKQNGRWIRVTSSSFEMNTARFVYADRIREAYSKGKEQDIRAI